MADLLFFADRVVLPYRPRAVVVYEGDNDLALGRSVREVLDQFRAFFAFVHSRLPRTRIYVLSVKPSPSRWVLWPRMRRLNRQLYREAEQDPRLCFVDTARAMLDERGHIREELFRKDRLHLNARGYALWRKVLRAVLLPQELPHQTGARADEADRERINRHSRHPERSPKQKSWKT